MPSSTDPQPIASDSIIPFAQSVIEEARPDTSVAYRKAIGSLFKYFPSCDLLFSDFTERAMRDWISCMLWKNVSVQTAIYYLENVAAIYNKAVKQGLAPKNPFFRQLKALLSDSAESAPLKFNDNSVKTITSLAKGNFSLSGEMKYYGDLLLFSFFCRGMRMSEILQLTSDDLPALPLQARRLAETYISPRRNKLFPREKVEEAERKTLMIAYRIGLHPADDMTVGRLAGALWIQSALILGIPYSTVRGCLGSPADFPLLGIADVEKVSPEKILEISEMVAESVTSNPPRWHIMKLRPYHTFADITRRIDETRTEAPEFFYPQEVIASRIGKKVEYQHRPILPDVVFFKATPSRVPALFRQIGDLAWCYRTTRLGGYAVVRPDEMKRFQQTIGVFTPDFEIFPIGTNPVGMGEHVRIIGGPMAGYEGEIFGISNDQSSANGSDVKPYIFRLRVTADNGIEWKMSVDSRLIERIETPRSTPPDKTITNYCKSIYYIIYQYNIRTNSFTRSYPLHPHHSPLAPRNYYHTTT